MHDMVTSGVFHLDIIITYAARSKAVKVIIFYVVSTPLAMRTC